MIELALLALVVLLLAGAPVALALASSALVYYATSPMPTELVMQRLVAGVDSFPIIAIPLFVLVGTLMAAGGIAHSLLGFADGLVGHRRGGLAQVNVMNSVMMGGMSGSAIADGAVDAKVLVPVMVKNGYSLTFSSALSAATGVIAPMLPPGIGLIVYGLVAQVSVGRLFLGGVVPGLLLALAMAATVSLISSRRGFTASRAERLPLTQVRKHFVHAIPALMMPVLLIVGLRMGVFTPTELAAIAAVYAFIVGYTVYRQFNLRELPRLLLDAAHASAGVMLLLMAGSAFAAMITLERIPQSVAGFFLGMTTNKIIFLLVTTVLLLVLGMFLDGLTLLVLTTPILAAAAAAFSVDPIHFGVTMVLLLTIGGITPPLGIVVFTVVQITKADLMATFKDIMPFFAACVAVSLVVVYVPATVTWLPNVLMGTP